MVSPVCLSYILSKSESLGRRRPPRCLCLCPAARAHRPDKFGVRRRSNLVPSAFRIPGSS